MASRLVPLTSNRFYLMSLAVAAVWLAGCSRTLHPQITVVPNGVNSFLISGSGFSTGSTCASLNFVPKSTSLPWNLISTGVSCSGGVFNNYQWTPPSMPGCTANTPGNVLAVDPANFDLASASVSIPCIVAAVCPGKLTEVCTTSPRGTMCTAWSNATMTTYFSGGSDASVTNIPASMPSEALNFDTCSQYFAFGNPSWTQVSKGYLNGVQLAPGPQYTQCTYTITGTSAPLGNGCYNFTPNGGETIKFTCPDTLAGCGQ